MSKAIVFNAANVPDDVRLTSLGFFFAEGLHFFELVPVENNGTHLRIGLSASDALRLASNLIDSVNRNQLPQ